MRFITKEPDSQLKSTSHDSSDDNYDAEVGHGAGKETVPSSSTANDPELTLKVPALTIVYWCEKMTATTFGETFADFFSQTLGLGYSSTSAVLILVFLITLAFQLKVKTYRPALFWLVMGTSSIAGTCISDFIDRTLHWGYPLGMSVLFAILLVLMGVWKLTGEPMNVAGAMNRKAESLYWSTILVSNTLGTALGDFLADSLELGFGMSAGIIGGLLAICALLAYLTRLSPVLLFWIAFILTRPFGATFGDLLTKDKSEGGSGLGTWQASLIIFGLFLMAFAYELFERRKKRQENEQKIDGVVDEE